MKYGCIGHPIAHSFSRELHEKLGNIEYGLRDLAPEALAGFTEARDFFGINVTVPYKEAVLPFLDEVEDDAKKIGAVNTVKNENGRLVGYNTDFYGVTTLIRASGVSVKRKRVFILGTGGTAKVAKAAFDALGAKTRLVSRTGKAGALTYDAFYACAGKVQILVNATPVGMAPKADECPVDLGRFPSLIAVFDAVYRPLHTVLLREAEKRKIPAFGGLLMLAAQGVLADAIFFDKPRKDLDEVTQALYHTLRAEKENIVLVGLPGVGKTTVGREVAAKLKRPFIDTDELITASTGKTPEEIIRTAGIAAFRAFEKQAVLLAAGHSGAVIATGGGAMEDETNAARLCSSGKLFFLDRPIDEIPVSEERPLSPDHASLASLSEKRRPSYLSHSDAVITDFSSIIATVNAVILAFQSIQNQEKYQ